MLAGSSGTSETGRSTSSCSLPVLRCEAVRGAGTAELAETLDSHRAYLEERGLLAQRRERRLTGEVLTLATARMRRELEAALREDPEVIQVLAEVAARRLDPARAATLVLARARSGEMRIDT